MRKEEEMKASLKKKAEEEVSKEKKNIWKLIKPNDYDF